MSTPPELHVIFGTGPLGQAVMRELIARGKPVRMVNQHGKAPVPPQVEVIASDAYNPSHTREVCRGALVVYQCAQPPYHEWVDKFPRLQASIVEGAAANDATLVVGDNLYMYGAVNGPLSEDLPNNAHTRKGRIRAQIAESILAAHARRQVRAVIGRGADFFGPGVRNSVMGERIFPAVLAGKRVTALGNIDLPHTYTFIDDFGKALVVLGEQEQALGQIWHIPNAETVTTQQFITMAFEEARHPPKVHGMSKLMLRIGGIFVPAARESVEMMYQFEQPFIVDHSKYVRAFGNHATPLREAIRRTLTWYRQHKQS